MNHLPRYIILLSFFLTSYAFAQQSGSNIQHPLPGEQQINAWTKSLSIKKDPLEKNHHAVYNEIIGLDSSIRCQTIDRIGTRAQDKSVRSQIRVKMIQARMAGSRIHCPGEDSGLEYYQKALQAAYEIEDAPLQSNLHISIGQEYNALSQFGLATMHFQMFFDILGRNNRADFHLPSGAFYDLSFGLYHTHEYEASIRAGLNALDVLTGAKFQPDNQLNEYQQMLQWNTIGLAYNKIHHHDSAFVAFAKAEQIARKSNTDFWIGIINGNKGDVYYNLGRYDSAYVLLQYDYERSIAESQSDNAANSLQWIARIDLKQGRTKEALQKLHSARQLLYQKPQATYLSNVYYAYSQAYTSLGRADSVNHYLQQYLHLHDSLQTEISNSRTDIVQMRMNNLDQIQTIKILNRQKRQIALTRNFTIAIVILLGCLGYLLLNRLRLKMLMRQREALEGKRLAEAETKKAIEQLDTFRQHLLEKNTMIEKLETAYESKEISEDQIKRLSDLSHHLILNEDDWNQFKILFDSVYPGFFLSLRNKVPDITQAEQRMAALSKLKLTAREAANLLGVSPNTVYTTRRRLRQRLSLEQDSDLDPFLSRNEFQ